MFKERKLGKNEEPEIRINDLENLWVMLEVKGSDMTDEKFLIQFLNSLNSDYKLKEKRIGNKMNPVLIDEFKEHLNLKY